MIYNVEVNDRIISLISIKNEDGENVDSVGGNKGDEVRFTIYGDLNRTDAPIRAAFLWNGKYHLEDVIEIDAMQGLFYCYVPPISNSNNFYLGLYIGEDADEAPYLSTNKVEIPCKLSIRDYIKVPQDSHLGKYTDIVAFNAKRAEIAATNAANSEKESRESAESAGEDAVSAKADAERAEAAADKTESLEERVFGKEVEWKAEEMRYDDGVPTNLIFEGLEPKKYYFTVDTADKKSYQAFDLTGMQVGETRTNDSANDVGLQPNTVYLEFYARMETNSTISVAVWVYTADSIGDIFEYTANYTVYCTEYFEPSMQDQVTTLDARVTALESASGGSSGGSGGNGYAEETELMPQTVDYLSEGFILNAPEGTFLRVKFEDKDEIDWWNEWTVTIEDGHDSGATTMFNGELVHACVAWVQDYEGGVWALYFTDDYGNQWYLSKSVYVQAIVI